MISRHEEHIINIGSTSSTATVHQSDSRIVSTASKRGIRVHRTTTITKVSHGPAIVSPHPDKLPYYAAEIVLKLKILNSPACLISGIAILAHHVANEIISDRTNRANYQIPRPSFQLGGRSISSLTIIWYGVPLQVN